MGQSAAFCDCSTLITVDISWGWIILRLQSAAAHKIRWWGRQHHCRDLRGNRLNLISNVIEIPQGRKLRSCKPWGTTQAVPRCVGRLSFTFSFQFKRKKKNNLYLTRVWIGNLFSFTVATWKYKEPILSNLLSLERNQRFDSSLEQSWAAKQPLFHFLFFYFCCSKQ